MAGVWTDPTRAPVAFGRWAVRQLFAELGQAEAGRRQRALASLCDLMHDPERLHQAVRGGTGTDGRRPPTWVYRSPWKCVKF